MSYPCPDLQGHAAAIQDSLRWRDAHRQGLCPKPLRRPPKTLLEFYHILYLILLKCCPVWAHRLAINPEPSWYKAPLDSSRFPLVPLRQKTFGASIRFSKEKRNELPITRLGS